MPVFLQSPTDGHNGDAVWGTAPSGGGGIPLGAQRGGITASNGGDGFPRGDGFVSAFATFFNTSARSYDAGGVGVTQNSSGAGGDNYITGGITDDPGSAAVIFTEMRPLYQHRFRLDTVADGRFFAGFSPAESSAEASDSDDPATPYFGIQFSPDTRGDVNLMIAGKSVGGGTQVLVDTGVAPAVAAVYRLVIDATSPTSWTATLYQDSDGTAAFVSTVLFTTTVTDTDGIPAVGAGYSGCISFSETVAAVVSFTHYFWEAYIRSGVQISGI